MRTNLNWIWAICLITGLVISGCYKQPHADFIFDKKTVHPSQIILCTNKSSSGYHYKWILPDGSTSNSTDLELQASSVIGEKTVRLQAFSRNNKKTSEISKTYTVIDYDNKSFAGIYNGHAATNHLYTSPVTISVQGNDKITIDDGSGLLFDFVITSSTGGTLVPKLINQYPEVINFKSGSISRSGNTVTINLVHDYTSVTNPQNNYSNYPSTDVITK